MFEVIFLIIISGYFIQSILFSIGVSKKFPRLEDDELPSATVLVAARNEEENIFRTLQSLDKLIYPDYKLEIIIVDDQSSDKTGELIDDFIREKKRFKKIKISDENSSLKGKTRALAEAIKSANGEIILTTDADCEVNPLWAKTLASYFKKDVGVVNGFTTQKTYNNFSGMQAIDFVYLITIAAGSVNLKMPVSCIGNNMSFKKQAYYDAGGYENLPFSVTEDFLLLNAINQLKKYKIIYPLDKDSLVTSLACKNFKDLFNQKKRWAVGGMKIPLTGFLIISFGFAANLLTLLTPLFFSTVSLYLAVLKIATDYFLLFPVHQRLGLRKNLNYFFLFELYYLIYIVLLPFILLFSRKVKWKGRKYN